MAVDQSPMNKLITEHIDIWTSAVKTKSTSGRGSSKKLELYGIKKLRELILELAVRGKLVPQDPNDEPASVLLERIASEKAQLIKDKKIKKPKKLLALNDEDIPFGLPEGWEWSQVNELAKVVTDGVHHTPKYLDNGVPFISVKDIDGKSISFDDCKYISQEQHEEINQRCNPEKGDILLCRIGTLGRATIVDTEKAFSLFVSVGLLKFFNEQLLPEYLHTVFHSPLLLRQYDEIKAGGSHTNKLNLGDIPRLKIPVAPLQEQRRIVAKVDELMALCDQLEQQTEASIEAHQVLVTTLLDTLTNSANADELMQNWARISEHFETLFTTEESIDQLKQTILQLAVMGKLVPQDPSDEPASELLKRVAKEKAQLVKEKKIKKQKALPPISEDEKPFELPNGWVWSRFADVINEVATGPFGSMINKREYISKGVPLINPSHMINQKIIEDSSISVSDDKAKELNSYRIKPGDILMARRGEMGRCALVTEREHNWLCGTGSFVLKFQEEIYRPYILLLFQTSWVRAYLGGNSVGSTMINLNHTILNKMPILIPPKQEQVKIVSKVIELLDLCNDIADRVVVYRETQLKLANAIVDQMV
ncbi:restriction endonuclease subunit S [Vibrio fluvialis]|nr:restriction endonuclease subunit S [Vibrio fluvialis]